MKRTSLTRKARLKSNRSLSAEEKRAYKEVTEEARHEDGYLVCAICSLPIPEGTEHRAHEKGPGTRKQKTIERRFRIVHAHCHSEHDHHGGLPHFKEAN